MKFLVCLVQDAETQSADGQHGDRKIEDWKAKAGARVLRRAPDKGSVPQGAVVLQNNDVLGVMRNVIYNWKPEREMLVILPHNVCTGICVYLHFFICRLHVAVFYGQCIFTHKKLILTGAVEFNFKSMHIVGILAALSYVLMAISLVVLLLLLLLLKLFCPT